MSTARIPSVACRSIYEYLQAWHRWELSCLLWVVSLWSKVRILIEEVGQNSVNNFSGGESTSTFWRPATVQR
eukprot:4390151-Amphidinium_carterae.1